MGVSTLVSEEELRKFDLYDLMKSDTTGSKAIQTSTGLMQPLVRSTHSIKGVLADEKTQKEQANEKKATSSRTAEGVAAK